MDRYNELKVQLKNWETGFLAQHKRKPNKADIDNATEDTKNLYKEYRALKEGREQNSSTSGSVAESCPSARTPGLAPPATEPQTEFGADIWGSHLNRAAMPLKLTSKDRDSLKASAQFFGMKLKANLGGAIKGSPSSLRKPFSPKWKPRNGLSEAVPKSVTPTRNPTNAFSDGFVPNAPVSSPITGICNPCSTPTMPPGNSVAGKPLNGLSDILGQTSVTASPLPSITPSENGSHLETDDDFPPLKLGFNLPKLNLTPTSSPLQPNKFLQLRQTVGQRLTSLDPSWLDRCRGIKGQAASRPEAEGAPATDVKIKADLEISSPLHPQPSSSDTRLLQSPDHLIQTDLASGDQTSSARAASPQRASHSQDLAGKTEDQMPTHCHKAMKSIGSALKAIKTVKENEERRHITHHSGAVGLTVPAGDCESPIASKLQDQRPAIMYNPAGDGVQEAGMTLPSTDDSPPQKKIKRAGRKRQRDTSVEKELTMDAPSVEEGTAKKRRRTKASTAPMEKKSAPVRRRKTKADQNNVNEEDGLTPTSTTKKSTMPTENLFGDIEEDVGKIPSTLGAKTSRPSINHNANFVRINLKNKSHVKGYALKGNHLRKQMWKQKYLKKGEQFGGGGRHFNRSSDTCFRCGETGHWASDCKGKAAPLLPQEDDVEEEEIVLPTLEEVARLTNTQLQTSAVPFGSECSKEELQEIEEPLPLDVVRPAYEPPVAPTPMEPMYPLGENGKVQETPREVLEALSELGYRSFRPGQEIAIMRILSGLSTLVVLSTGMGKSLCYQLPAYLYAKRSKCITLVISPLVSLMDDQVSGLPSQLKAVCIHSNMTKSQREAAIEKVKQGSVHVLLLSPEALVGGGFSGSSCLPPADQLPPVAFACIDEAHCVSEWSHNFRPCYLRLCKVLRDRLGVRCLLGLTATATLATAQDISHHLGVSEEEEGGIAVRSAAVPSNLHLSVSMDREKDQALVSLLKGDRFSCLDSVIVYCTRREETARIAALLRTCLQGVTLKPVTTEEAGEEEDIKSKRKKAEAKKKIRKPLKWISESYHAGMSAAQRRRVQNNFMSGQLRVVVATVAFGMGLDKSDVRGIVHYNMPKNFESYVQEIGRAGRDGKPAHCHLFLDPEGGDLNELRRHIFADTVDYFTIKKLVQKVFLKCKCREIQQKTQALNMGEVDDEEMMDVLEECEEPAQPSKTDLGTQPRVCYKHERAVPIEPTVQALDAREEGIETLLCYLELHPRNWLEMLHPTLSACRIICYGGPQQLRTVAKRCPPIAVCLARERLAGKDHTHCSELEFNVVELADSMGWEVLPVKRALRQLQWNTEFQKGFRGTGKSGVFCEFSNLSFHLRSYGDLSDQELDMICEFLHQKVVTREKAALYQLQACFKAFKSVAFRSCSRCADEVNVERSEKLKAQLMEYFEKKLVTDENGIRVLSDNEDEEDEDQELQDVKLRDCESLIRADISQFLSIRSEEKFSGRAVARILHGIGSPCYPPQVYGRDRRYWRKYIHFDFNELIRLATEEIIRWK
ncbi:ATP-dependent DNA helicase Q4 isoform X2 [Pleurodeles waltl]|uniref:ATP-dependent DNA helicase Q4 isoform X2 n=1 Tax=Pleurodeles waltl TaxID=8319 RepID=UPI0037093AE4